MKEVAACLLAYLLYLPAWEAFMSCHSNENISLCFALWCSPALSCHVLPYLTGEGGKRGREGRERK